MRLLEGDGLIVMRLFGVGPVLGFQLKSDYEGAQAAFKSASPDKIYIDINAGLMSGKDVSDLAKYAMLRTFSHEFIHFVEYWNPVQYNVLRKLVFDEITARGENVNDLIQIFRIDLFHHILHLHGAGIFIGKENAKARTHHQTDKADHKDCHNEGASTGCQHRNQRLSRVNDTVIDFFAIRAAVLAVRFARSTRCWREAVLYSVSTAFFSAR